MFFSKLAALAVTAVAVGAIPTTPTTPTFPPSVGLNNEDGKMPYEYVAPPLPAAPVPLTNAERLARGLAVRPPVRVPVDARADLPIPSGLLSRQIPSGLPLPRRQLPSGLPIPRRQLPSALPVPKRQLPSGLPLPRRQLPSGLPLPKRQAPIAHHGNIRVEYANKTTLGYIAHDLNKLLEFTSTDNTTDAAHVTFKTDAVTPEPFNLVVADPYNNNLANIGGIIGPKSKGASLFAGSGNHAFLVGTDASEPGARPSPGSGTRYSNGARESAIWNLDTVSSEVYPVWVNEDTTTANKTLILAVEDYFVLAGDQAALEKSYGVKSEEVLFFFEEATPI